MTVFIFVGIVWGNFKYNAVIYIVIDFTFNGKCAGNRLSNSRIKCKIIDTRRNEFIHIYIFTNQASVNSQIIKGMLFAGIHTGDNRQFNKVILALYLILFVKAISSTFGIAECFSSYAGNVNSFCCHSEEQIVKRLTRLKLGREFKLSAWLNSRLLFRGRSLLNLAIRESVADITGRSRLGRLYRSTWFFLRSRSRFVAFFTLVSNSINSIGICSVIRC